jgi:tetratricopeptide (TPR) repeat protein
MTTSPQTFATALKLFQAGQQREAEELCRRLVLRDPGHASSLNLLGMIAHQAGQHDEAVSWIRQAISFRPENPEFHYNLGVAQQFLGRLEEAVASYRLALRLGPDSALAHNNLASALLRLGRLDEALASAEQALRLAPSYAEAHANRGEALRQQGCWEEAIASLKQAMQLDPGSADACNYLGLTFSDQRQPDEARACFLEALRLNPNFAEAHHHLGVLFLWEQKFAEARASFEEALRIWPDFAEAHNSMGVLLREQGKQREACSCFEEALRLKDDFAAAHNNLGKGHESQGRLDEAVRCYRRALELQPNSALFLINLGNALAAQGQPGEALPFYRRAIRLQPAEAAYLSNLSNALTLTGRPDEGEAYCRQALRLKPDFADAYHNLGITFGARGEIARALVFNAETLRLNPDHVGARNCQAMWWLQMGDFARGWEEYEWRWKKAKVPPRDFPQPLWDGSSLEGRTVLIHTEQGLGDTLQFIRYAPMVKQRGGTVIVESPIALGQLLASCTGIDRLIARGAPQPPFDVHAPLLSLPRIFGTTLANVPANVPYLWADPPLVESWRRELSAVPGVKIGIAWQGNPRFPADCMRSIPLTHFTPLAQIDGVRLFSLQKGTGREQLQAVASYLPVVDLADRLDETTGGFMDTAAVMKNLDLVVTSDTSIAHLAGALGVPVWVALAVGADWRFLLGRDDSPWYPTMRLFRQTRMGDWDGVFERIASELCGSPDRPQEPLAQPPPVRVEIPAGDLIDKITILEIKCQRIHDAAKLGNIRAELATLVTARDGCLPPSAQLTALSDELFSVNEALWSVEDALRVCEQNQDFGSRFVELARSVYGHNDRRAALKRRINELLGSRLIEEKSYASQ